jgi:hypothetical protein
MVKLELYYPKTRQQTSTRLWRYMDVYKFYDMVQQQHIPLPRMSSFSDPLEGIPLGLILDLKENNSSIQDYILKRDLLPPESQKRIDSYWMIQRSTYVSCWFHSKQESMAMWDLYAGKDGVAISVDAASLIGKVMEYLDSVEDYSINAAYAGFVKYKDVLDFQPAKDIENMKVSRVALRKHSSYDHEKEFRIVFRRREDSDVNFLSIPIPSFHLIDSQFYTHPGMQPWKRFSIQRMAAQNGLDIPVLSSRIPIKG